MVGTMKSVSHMGYPLELVGFEVRRFGGLEVDSGRQLDVA
jgi:hypothetical protein